MSNAEKPKLIRVMTSDELKAFKIEKVKGLIPKNPSYCYKSIRQDEENPSQFPITELCLYWRIASDKPETLSGYCLFMEQGDWEDDGTIALFDQLKNCGINDNWSDTKHTKGSLDFLILEHEQMQSNIVDKTLKNSHWSLPKGLIENEYRGTQLDKQFGRAKNVYRRLFIVCDVNF